MTAATGKRRKNDSLTTDEFFVRPFIRPQWSVDQLRQHDRAARAYAANNASDPFAYRRALAHMKNGVADSSDFPGAKTATSNS